MLGAVINGFRAAIKNNNGGSMQLSREGRKSRAVQSFCKALERRKWIPRVSGVYTCSGVTIDTRTQGFHVLVQDKFKAYQLPLGKGAIRELDKYMRLRQYQI